LRSRDDVPRSLVARQDLRSTEYNQGLNRYWNYKMYVTSVENGRIVIMYYLLVVLVFDDADAVDEGGDDNDDDE
jgi:hypothetical protein